jgi:hypothetical protein
MLIGRDVGARFGRGLQSFPVLDKSPKAHQFQFVGLIHKQLQLGEQARVKLPFRRAAP